jgi:transcriptional regulator with XRE-family HTH domain
MATGDRIRDLRVEKHWTQAELGKKLHVHQKQISMYERGMSRPSTEMLMRMAQLFGVTLEYLAHDASTGDATPKRQIQDRELLRRFETIDAFPEAYRTFAKEFLDLLILRRRFREMTTMDDIRDTEPQSVGLG